LFSLPLALILSLVGIFVDEPKTSAKIGLILSVVNVLFFFGLPVIMTLIC